MITTRTIGRIGILAAGLGIGTALATGTATADTSNDWASSIDSLLGGALPAATSPTDFQISFNGMDLFPTTGNFATAYTEAGQYGLAIAYGNGAFAYAGGGTGDFALASGTNAVAEAGSVATGATGNDYDTAVDIGNNGLAAHEGAFAGNSSVTGGGPDAATGASHDSAYDIGNNGGAYDGAFAGSTDTEAGSGDTAYDYGNNIGYSDGASADEGSNNYASDSGTNSSNYEGADAEEGNGNSAIVDTSYSTFGAHTFAGIGNDNYAYVYGPDNSTSFAEGGNSNVAYIDDPYGMSGTPDAALAGTGNSDLAEVLFTHGDANAMGTLMYDIVSLFGNQSGMF